MVAQRALADLENAYRDGKGRTLAAEEARVSFASANRYFRLFMSADIPRQVWKGPDHTYRLKALRYGRPQRIGRNTPKYAEHLSFAIPCPHCGRCVVRSVAYLATEIQLRCASRSRKGTIPLGAPQYRMLVDKLLQQASDLELVAGALSGWLPDNPS